VLVALNMSARQQKLNLDWASHGIHAATLNCLYASPATKLDNVEAIELAPFGAVVAEIR